MAFLNKLSIFVIALETAFYFCDGKPTRTIQLPQSCKGKTFCFTSDNYPSDIVENLLATTNLTVISGQTTSLVPHFPSNKPDIEHRIGDDDEVEICTKNITKLPIYYIVDENENVRVVVQSATFLQLIEVEECWQEGPLELPTDDLFTRSEADNLICENLKLDYKFLVLSLDLSALDTVKNKGGLPVACAYLRKVLY